MDERKYGNEYDLAPLFAGEISYSEPLMFIGNEDGTTPDAPLLFDPIEVLQVTASTCDVEYRAGVDYDVVDGKIRRLAGGAMPILKYDEVYPPKDLEGVMCFEGPDGRRIACRGEHFYHKHQVWVTYRHAPAEGFCQPDRTELLPRTMAALREGKPWNLMFFGDSITTPADVSGNGNHTAPDMPSWPELVAKEVQTRWPAVTYTNTAVGGMATPWGVDNVIGAFSPCVPDAAVIGFGMNDATGDMPPMVFVGNICHIMERARTLNPNMEFILVATTVANPRAPLFDKTQREHEPLFLALEHEGVAVLRMTSMHEALLAKKRFYDMTGNNINHPNDYLSRAYAQSLLALLGL